MTLWGRKLLSEVPHWNDAVEVWYTESDYESEEKKISVTEGTYLTGMHHMAMLIKNIQHKLKLKIQHRINLQLFILPLS